MKRTGETKKRRGGRTDESRGGTPAGDELQAGLYDDLLSLLVRHDPMGISRRSLPVEHSDMVPTAIATGMEPPPLAVRPPESARERLGARHGSELRAAMRKGRAGAVSRDDPAEHLRMRREYGRVYNDALAIMSRHDPKLVTFAGPRPEEYAAEARALLPQVARAESEEAVRHALDLTLSTLVGREALVGRDGVKIEVLDSLARDLWQKVRKR